MSRNRNLLIYFSFTLICCGISTNKFDVSLVEFALSGDRTPISSDAIGAVFDLGEAEMKQKYGNILNVTHERLSDPRKSSCYETDHDEMVWAAKYYYWKMQGNPIMAMLGPVCSFSTSSLGNFARAWNKVLMTPVTGDAILANKTLYPTVIRLSPYVQEDLGRFVFTVLKNFNYSTVGILCDGFFYGSLCRALYDTLSAHNFTTSRFSINSNDRANLMHYFKEVRNVARVIIIVAPTGRIRPIMLGAFDSIMTNGEFVYFTFDLPSTAFMGNMFWDTGNADGRDEDAKTAYKSLFKISLRNLATPAYTNFSNEVKRLSANSYGYTYAPDQEVSPFAVSYYYALAIYGQILHETITANGDPQDGVRLANMMRNRTFTILGQDIFINSNGDRDSDWSLNQMDSDDVFRPVLEYFARDKVLIPAKDANGADRQIVWYLRDSPPPNEPRCGYNGTKPECSVSNKTSSRF